MNHVLAVAGRELRSLFVTPSAYVVLAASMAFAGFLYGLGLGFFLPSANEPTGPNLRAFGHGGAGGSFGMADPENRVSFGYVMNLMNQGLWLVDPRPRRRVGL